MASNDKQLSNPFSTGSGGARFEAHIQATFVTLMLSSGFAPCLPAWPIVEIKLQGKIAGYCTDDLIVTVENNVTNERRKLLGQVKNSISITEKNETFKEVIQAAWSDFNNSSVFTKSKDVIALITGPISATDIDGVNGLLEQARHTQDANEFLTQVERANFCSSNVRNKLKAFKAHLNTANSGRDISEQDLFDFLKHFHLLGYDLAKKGSVISSLLQSHIAQFNKEIPSEIWSQIVTEVQDFNQFSGTITKATLSEELIKHFKEPKVEYISKEFIRKNTEEENTGTLVITNWSQHASARKLTLACLIGSWNENNEADIKVVTQITGENYREWIVDLRELLQIQDCLLSYENGIWKFKDRLNSWHELAERIFDDHLDTFKVNVLEVLRVNDPSFELSQEERYAAGIHGKVLPHSSNLREGLAVTLALIGGQATSLTHCSQGKAESITLSTIRGLFNESDWIRWGSLNSLLPILSEANPEEFLTAVEDAIYATPSPFDILFEQEDSGVFGRNYITGLLWALEGIAWEEAYLNRTAVVLAEIASHDPGGNWANRPENSLTNIFLPWKPHTFASIQKRQVALRTVCSEQPEVGWKLLESLLPNQHTMTSGTYKPRWRGTISVDEEDITTEEYWEQSRFCAELIVEQTGLDVDKLALLTSKYDQLPPPASDRLKEKLLSDYFISLPEHERIPIWDSLSELIARHRRFSDADWALDSESLDTLEKIKRQLAPNSSSLKHKRLFSASYVDLYESLNGEDWQEKEDRLFQLRKEALAEILDEGGLPKVLDFALTVSNPYLIGSALADLERSNYDAEILPNLLGMTNVKLWSLVSAYASRSHILHGWQWFDSLEKASWTPKQIALLLSTLPFEKDAWDRASQLLGNNEHEYWSNTGVNIRQSKNDTDFAFRKLLEVNRPTVVIDGLQSELFDKKQINTDIACEALLTLVKSDETSTNIDRYSITEIIKALQQDVKTDPEKLFQVEWAYVSLLGKHSSASPVTLENRLASDPKFFCELIQLIYRAEGENTEEKPSEHKQKLALNAYRLFSTWSIIPGTRADSEFDPDAFKKWLCTMEERVRESGHYDVAMLTLGRALVKAPEGTDGLWIHPAIAEAMNDRKRSNLRDGYRTGVFNSRGVHTVDPEAKPEKALAVKYRKQAEEIENAGYHRLATTLRELAMMYDKEAERILSDKRLQKIQ